jgi:hypothetical protein
MTSQTVAVAQGQMGDQATAALTVHETSERTPGKETLITWQDRMRDPSLTVLLILEVCAIFFAGPLAAKGLPIARQVADTLLFSGLLIVVMLSRQWGAITMLLLGSSAVVGSLLLGVAQPSISATMLHRGGDMLAFSALTWVVARAVYAPGPITSQRLQGAVVVYLSLGTIFASAYGLLWELNSGAFVNLGVSSGSPKEVAVMLYFSLTTLTSTGYGDIVAVDPLARSLANLESVIGQFFLTITVARLVTLQLEDFRRRVRA